MIVDIQYSPATNDWPALRDAVLRAEDEGYATTWVFDHFDGQVLGGDRPMLESFTLLGALAVSTTTIGIGTLVANVANRHPALLALAASSVQRISGGRLVLGLGAGTRPGTAWSAEHERHGIELRAGLADRHDAVDEQIERVRAMVDVPIIVGVNSVALAERATRNADGINVRMSHRRADEFVAAARASAGERPFEVSGWAFLSDDNARDRAGELDLDRLVLVDLGSLR